MSMKRIYPRCNSHFYWRIAIFVVCILFSQSVYSRGNKSQVITSAGNTSQNLLLPDVFSTLNRPHFMGGPGAGYEVLGAVFGIPVVIGIVLALPALTDLAYSAILNPSDGTYWPNFLGFYSGALVGGIIGLGVTSKTGINEAWIIAFLTVGIVGGSFLGYYASYDESSGSTPNGSSAQRVQSKRSRQFSFQLGSLQY